MKPPLFTPRSARQAALSLHATLTEAAHLFRALERHAPLAGIADRPVDPTYFAGVCRLVQVMEQLRAAGAAVDLAQARLRFPARRQGREVELRWSLAEPDSLWLGDALAEEDGAWEERG